MLYRIKYKNFLLYMIDYLTREELLHCQYVLVTFNVGHQGMVNNVARVSVLYPNSDIIIDFADDHDEEKAKRAYAAYMFPPKDGKVNPDDSQFTDPNWFYKTFYRYFVTPSKQHHSVVLIYDDNIEMYMEVLCDLAKKKFGAEFLNLNDLFEKGRTGPIYLDMKEVHHKVREKVKKILVKEDKCNEATEEGRSKLVAEMTLSEKIKKLKSLGVKLSKDDLNEEKLNSLLYEAWVLND